MRRAIFQLASIAAIVCGCMDVEGPRPLGPNAATKSIGSAGGTLTSKDGAVRLDIPAGALAVNRTVSIDELALTDVDAAFAGRNIERAYEMGPDRTQFDKPVRVTVRSSQRLIRTDSTVQIPTRLLLTTENGIAVPLDSLEISTAGDTVFVSGLTNHFSPLVIDSESEDLAGKISGIPTTAEVNRPFDVTVTVTPTSDIAPPVLTHATYVDASTLIVGTLPPGGTTLPAQDNVIRGSISYRCPSTGPATLGSGLTVFATTTFNNQPLEYFYNMRTFHPRALDCVPRTSELRVQFEGDGGGTVVGGPDPVFTCTATCTYRLLETLDAELTATPNEDSRFESFSGQCGNSDVPGVAEPFRMAGDRLCIVTFRKKQTYSVSITKTGLGTGTVTGGGLDCGDKCTIQVPEGAKVELRSTPSIGSRHGSWGSGCLTTTPNEPVIELTVNEPVNCAVFYPLEKLTIVVSPSSPTIDVGSALQLDVSVSDETGPVTGREVTFLSGNPSVATVDGQGNVTGVSPGLATIVITVGGPGGGTVNVVVNVVQRMFTLTVTKTGAGRGTTTVVNTSNGASSDYCDPSCAGTTTEAVAGSVMHVLADPEDGSTFVRFLEDCALQAPASGPPTGVVEMTAAKSCTVEFGVEAPLSIAFGGLTSKSTGLSVALGNVSGVVYADYQTTNLPQSDSSLAFSVTLNGKPAGTCLPPSLGGLVRCEIDTGATVGMDSILPSLRKGVYANGTQSLQLIAKRFGDILGTHTEDVTLNNRNSVSITTNNPTGATSLTWRGGSIQVRANVTLFDDIPVTDFRPDFSSIVVTGSGTMSWRPGPANDPFVFTADPANSPTAHGAFQGTFRMFDANGNDITSLFDTPAAWQQNVDMVPPFLPSFSFPSTTFISGGVLILDNPTGPYPAGTRIRLNRITGGSLGGIDACDAAHYHGTISIRRENSSVSDGPFADPNGPACGHGKVVTEDFPNVLWSFGGTVLDRSPITTDMQMFNGVNGCDVLGIVDDTPILQGTAPGQSPFPSRTTTSNPFTGIFSLNVDGGMAEDHVCIRVRVQDSAVDATGQPANVVNRVLQTQLTQFVLPN